MADNIERTGVRDLWLSALMRKVPAPARHIDIDSFQYCRTCLSGALVIEGVTGMSYKHTYILERLAFALNVHPLLMRKNAGKLYASTQPEPSFELSEMELLAWMDGVGRLCECHSHHMISPLRYPGAKGRLSRWILRYLPLVDSLCEPFAGTAAITIAASEHGWPLRRIWLNDAHPGIAALWQEIKENPSRLLEWAQSFRPVLADWDRYLAMPRESPIRTVALHAMSFGGLGEKSGGPIGGKSQSSKYTIGCRWSSARFTSAVERWSPLLANAKITCRDAGSVIEEAASGGWFCYIDPPYVKTGKNMYSETFNPDRLEGLPGRWLMSIDDGEWVARIGKVVARKPVKTTLGVEYAEVLVSPPGSSKRKK